MPFSINCTEFFGSIFVRAIFNQLILRIFHLLHREIDCWHWEIGNHSTKKEGAAELPKRLNQATRQSPQTLPPPAIEK